jgi:UDP-3-O-[3-hydroxymyristoyl] glucosamine N-acyltransferase
MKFDQPISVQEIASIIDAKIIGNESLKTQGLNEINRVREGEILFVDHPKYYKKALNSSASAVIMNAEEEVPEGKAILFVERPFEAFQKLCFHFGLKNSWNSTEDIHTEAIIHPGTHIADGVKIGKGSVIYPGVVVYSGVEIGEYVEIHANAVIGSDAFYFNKKEGRYTKMVSVGRVIIQDNVSIGANCTIDKGVADDTVIGRGSKLDNLVHVGHDVVMGENVLIAAQVGIAGCTNIESNVSLWGQVGVNSKITIGEGASVYAQAGVATSLEGGHTYVGSPAQPVKSFFREKVILRKMAKKTD